MSCEHKNAESVPSYYYDTEWCPDCGAVRGSDGKFGPGSKMLEWQLPKCSQEKEPEAFVEVARDTALGADIDAEIAQMDAAIATAEAATAKLRVLNACKLWPQCGCKWDAPMCSKMKESSKA